MNSDLPEKAPIVNFTYFFSFYQYLFASKKKEMMAFIIITFILPVVPYIWVALKLEESSKRAFYGDGSMLTLCAGILCTYFILIFDFEDEDAKKRNILINLVLFLLYLFILYVFIECQLTLNRSWVFITVIEWISGVILFITFIIGTYFYFHKNAIYTEVEEFKKNRQAKKIAEKAEEVTQTTDGIKL
ncbi:hypothetical protein [Hymenobacter algoricola]|uniref:DUF4870 domain-containing protein n=1 Tax=Hymenobacter algoricola TaxID=486267 RepID=A0ABP7N3U0_9BACT